MPDESIYRFGAVIPAAGLSSRMGVFKPLLPFGSSTVIETAVGSVLPYTTAATVVIGHRGKEIREVLQSRFGDRLMIVQNPDYASSDMLTSVKIGLRTLRECDAFFLLPADMPLLAPQVYEDLIKACDSSAEILIPILDGRRGHPPLIASSVIPDILAYEGEGGLKAIFAGRRVKEIEVTDSGVAVDLDTPQDYERVIHYR